MQPVSELSGTIEECCTETGATMTAARVALLHRGFLPCLIASKLFSNVDPMEMSYRCMLLG